jgi:translation initiation factor IF-2
MVKVRVDELAREMGLTADDLFAQLKGMGFDVVNTTSTVDRAMIDMVKDMLVGQPKKRAVSGRRIVSVHKGTGKKADVQVRVEEPPPPEVSADLSAVLPPESSAVGTMPSGAAGAEAPPPGEAEKEAPADAEATAEKPRRKRTAKTRAVAEAEPPTASVTTEAGVAAVLAAPAETAAGAPVPPETAALPAGSAVPPAASEKAAPVRGRKRDDEGPLLTAMELERGIRVGGQREIPIVKATVHERAPVAPPARTADHAPGAPGVPGAPGIPGTEEEKKTAKEKPKRAAVKKEKKVTRADLMRQVDEMAVPGEEEAPELKVVEIKNHPLPATTGPRSGRRPEPPRRRIGRKPHKKEPSPVREEPREQRTIRIEPGITVADLARLTGTKAPIIVKMLFDLGIMSTINQPVDPETAALLVAELGFKTDLRTGKLEEIIAEEADDEAAAMPRPPVITVMGHVDHGKTSLLDAIRKSDVAAGEAGGITQHIGAYTVHHAKGSLTFLDTPGHEAFTAMRARGAAVTDIVVLVVAADDGVMPQTIEAIDHAKAAGVPVIVAVNKIDKPEANPERVKQALAEKGVVAEEWGGDAQFSYVSAKKKTGIDDLLDKILLQAEMMGLRADPGREARGTVIESRLDKGRGPVATVLVQKGTLRTGDIIVAGAILGKIRMLHDDKGKKIKEAPPSTPVEVVGLPDVPLAGEPFLVFRDELKARRVANKHAEAGVVKAGGPREKITLEDLSARIKGGEVKELRLILKADVQGSVEAVREALIKLSTEAVRVKIIHDGTGAINESDVTLALASQAIILGFNVRPDGKALDLSRREKVDVRFYNIIYNAVNDVRNALRGLLAPVLREQFLGRAEVRQTFSVPKIGVIAGSFVQDGLIRRNARVRILRDGVVVNEGKVSSLKRFKDDAREVTAGYECGIGVENFNDLKTGDVLEAFEIVEEAAEL